MILGFVCFGFVVIGVLFFSLAEKIKVITKIMPFVKAYDFCNMRPLHTIPWEGILPFPLIYLGCQPVLSLSGTQPTQIMSLQNKHYLLSLCVNTDLLRYVLATVF